MSTTFLHNPNMRASIRGRHRDSVPTFALFGEFGTERQPELVHCESIASRSARYNWTISSHRHDALAHLLHVADGRSVMLTDDGDVPLEPPAVVIVPSRIAHGFRFPRNVRGHVISFRTADEPGRTPFPLVSLLPAGGARCVSLGEDPKNAAEVARGVEIIAEEFGGRRADRVMLMHATLAVLLVRVNRLVGKASPIAPPGRSARVAAAFRELLERDYRKHLPMAAYARRLGVSVTHLNRICGEVFGVPAGIMARERVMLEARRELTFTARPVSEIAMRLGFADPAYFSRFFAKHAGVSARSFRRSDGGGRAVAS